MNSDGVNSDEVNHDGAGLKGGHPDALPAGTLLSEFQLDRVLGMGGFSFVYLAFDQTLQRHVAIKEYLPSAYAMRCKDDTVAPRSDEHKATFASGLRSFIEEARLLAKFEHPALVKVLRFWEANGTAYMAMQYYQGRTLRQIVRADPGFATEARLKALISPLLDAVALLHAEKCYHRDIAPDNIIVQPNGAPVLLDFGAARRVIGDMTHALTVVLKPGYAPIEQYAEESGPAQGPWTDVYAFAAVLYAAITGKPPMAAVARAYSDTLVFLSSNPPAGYSPQFLRAIDAALAVRPEDRPQSIALFRASLGLGAAQDFDATQLMPRARTPPAPSAPAALTSAALSRHPRCRSRLPRSSTRHWPRRLFAAGGCGPTPELPRRRADCRWDGSLFHGIRRWPGLDGRRRRRRRPGSRATSSPGCARSAREGSGRNARARMRTHVVRARRGRILDRQRARPECRATVRARASASWHRGSEQG